MSDLTVANTILEQIGGKKFCLMVGAKYLVGSERSLQFRFQMFRKANSCRILLTDDDLYTMEFYKIGRAPGCGDYEPVKVFEGLFFDMLAQTFKEYTGLETRFPSIQKWND